MVNKINVKILYNTVTVLGLLIVVFLVILGIQSGVFSSVESLQQFVMGYGILSPIIFVLIQIIQVVIPIIPGGISCLAGVVAFGPVFGFLLNYIGIVIGSIINFMLVKKYGKPFLLKVVSHRTYEKYVGWLDNGKNFEKLFALAIFSPIAPDDFLCLLAGLSKMTLKKFVMIILLCKPSCIIVYSFGLSMIMKVLTGAAA